MLEGLSGVIGETLGEVVVVTCVVVEEGPSGSVVACVLVD